MLLPIAGSIFVIVFSIWVVVYLIILPLVTKKKRQIVQIATRDENELVLCDDNTLWMHRCGVWQRLPDVPQDDESKK
jgi:hypothetical protein